MTRTDASIISLTHAKRRELHFVHELVWAIYVQDIQSLDSDGLELAERMNYFFF